MKENKKTQVKESKSDEKTALINRLSRIEGQIRGIKRLVEDNAKCSAILMQASATTAALNSFSKEMLLNNLKTAITEDLQAGNTQSLDEITQTLTKLLK